MDVRLWVIGNGWMIYGLMCNVSYFFGIDLIIIDCL